ncbi:hypothetical protein, partial [Enterococcus faecalis]
AFFSFKNLLLTHSHSSIQRMRKQPLSYLYNSKELFVQNIIFFHLTTSIRENPLLSKGCYSCYLSKKGYQNVLFHRNQPVIP